MSFKFKVVSLLSINPTQRDLVVPSFFSSKLFRFAMSETSKPWFGGYRLQGSEGGRPSHVLADRHRGGSQIHGQLLPPQVLLLAEPEREK